MCSRLFCKPPVYETPDDNVKLRWIEQCRTRKIAQRGRALAKYHENGHICRVKVECEGERAGLIPCICHFVHGVCRDNSLGETEGIVCSPYIIIRHTELNTIHGIGETRKVLKSFFVNSLSS